MGSYGNQFRLGNDSTWLSTGPTRAGVVSAWGSLPDGRFVWASRDIASLPATKGIAYLHDAQSVVGSEIITYTDDPSNAEPLCNIGGFGLASNCIDDIAFDGNSYAWIVTSKGNLYISTRRQDTSPGGPVKLIGKIPLSPGLGYSGIAFDNEGNVFYSSYCIGCAFIAKAPMSDPLNVTKVTGITVGAGSLTPGRVPDFGDLASCAYPVTDMTKAPFNFAA
ncbi:hypothetical protein BC940DRAFT_296812 [Gongronella butleri]|nr:hypothetical protein BC940DRAFT_296812 [Gongronella butleri]